MARPRKPDAQCWIPSSRETDLRPGSPVPRARLAAHPRQPTGRRRASSRFHGSSALVKALRPGGVLRIVPASARGSALSRRASHTAPLCHAQSCATAGERTSHTARATTNAPPLAVRPLPRAPCSPSRSASRSPSRSPATRLPTARHTRGRESVEPIGVTCSRASVDAAGEARQARGGRAAPEIPPMLVGRVASNA